LNENLSKFGIILRLGTMYVTFLLLILSVMCWKQVKSSGPEINLHNLKIWVS